MDSNAEHKRLEFADDGELGFWLERLLAKRTSCSTSTLRRIASRRSGTCSYGRWNGHERTIVYAREEVV